MKRYCYDPKTATHAVWDAWLAAWTIAYAMGENDGKLTAGNDDFSPLECVAKLLAYGYSQMELSRVLGVRQSTISRIYAGQNVRPSYVIVDALRNLVRANRGRPVFFY